MEREWRIMEDRGVRKRDMPVRLGFRMIDHQVLGPLCSTTSHNTSANLGGQLS